MKATLDPFEESLKTRLNKISRSLCDLAVDEASHSLREDIKTHILHTIKSQCLLSNQKSLRHMKEQENADLRLGEKSASRNRPAKDKDINM